MTQQVQTLLRQNGFEIVSGQVWSEKPTRSDFIDNVPRKMHLKSPVPHHDPSLAAREWICDVPFVSKKYLTEDIGKVTCKHCLKLANQVEIGYILRCRGCDAKGLEPHVRACNNRKKLEDLTSESRV